jgi:hypothetical protein
VRGGLPAEAIVGYPSSMARPAASLPVGAEPNGADQRVILHGVSWRNFETILAIRGDAAGVRISPTSTGSSQPAKLSRLSEL